MARYNNIHNLDSSLNFLQFKKALPLKKKKKGARRVLKLKGEQDNLVLLLKVRIPQKGTPKTLANAKAKGYNIVKSVYENEKWKRNFKIRS